MPADVSAPFDCRATAAVLHSGSTVAIAGHVAAIIVALSIRTAGPIVIAALVLWALSVYFAVRVRIDAQFFELLAAHSADDLDTWLNTAGLRKNAPPRTMQQRRHGALRLWRALVFAVVLEIVLTLAAVIRSLP